MTKILAKKVFAKYLSADGCFVKTIILLTVIWRRYYLFPDTSAFAFTRKPMKRNFAWSPRAIHLRSNTAFLSRLKFWFAKKLKRTCVLPRQIRAFGNYWDYAKLLVVLKRWCKFYANHVARIIDQHFAQKSRQTKLEVILQWEIIRD